MLEVNLQDNMIKLFKLTCRNNMYYYDKVVRDYGERLAYRKINKKSTFVKFTAEYSKGKLHGKLTLYYADDETILCTTQWVKGVIHGEAIIYNVEGYQHKFIYFDNGVRDYSRSMWMASDPYFFDGIIEAFS